jgi:parvulin-like peptidyl-prolyl isomerase
MISAWARVTRHFWPFPLAGFVRLGLAGSVLVACSGDQDPVVARVGSHEIRTSRLREFVTQLPEGLRVGSAGDAVRQRYLQDLIDRRLLLMEVQARGLDTSAVVRAEVSEAVIERARSVYRSREMRADPGIPQDELQHVFVEAGYNRERKLNAILVGTRQELEDVLARLAAGEEFADLARNHSLDAASAQLGGELGFVDPDLAGRLQVPPDVFLSLPKDKVSTPLSSGRQWHVVKFTEERPVSFDQVSSTIEARVRQERSDHAVEEHYEQLERQMQVSLEPEGLREVVTAYRNRAPKALTGSPIVLYRYDEGSLTVGSAQAMFARMNRTQGLADSAQAVATLRKSVLRPFLLDEAARRAGILEEPELRLYGQRQRLDSELEALRRVAIKDKAEPSEEQVRQYYDEHPELFHHERSVWAEELLLADETKAQQVRQKLNEGTPFAALTEQSLRHDAVEKKGLYHYHPRERALYPDLVPALLVATEGQVEGPMQMSGGYSVFRVLRREEGGVETFDVAKRRARGLLRRRLEADALDNLLATLRERYDSQVSIDEARLRDALPDGLLEN